MSEAWARCGHPRTPENTRRGGINPRCLTCARAYYAGVRETTLERNTAIVTASQAGETIEILAARYSLKKHTVEDILRESGGGVRAILTDPTFSERAMKTAAELAGANVKQLQSDWRSPKVLVHARWAYAVAMRKRGVSTPSIGRRLNRDHSTIVYAIQQAGYLAARSPEFAEMMAKVDAA